MLVYAIRHAESQSNAGDAGALDTALSCLGVQQAEALSKRLSRRPVAALYCSPYKRCLETARPIADSLGLQVRIRPELCEYHHMESSEISEARAGEFDALLRQFDTQQYCPDLECAPTWPRLDESFAGLLDRARAFVSYLKSRWQDSEEAVIVVSHGSPIARTIEAWITDTPGRAFRFVIDNAAISALRYHAGISSLVSLNEISHLADLVAPRAANFREDGSIKAAPPSSYW